MGQTSKIRKEIVDKIEQSFYYLLTPRSKEDTLLESKEYTIDELRAVLRREVELRGKTLEEECDEIERLTGSKAYANVLRELYGIEIK